MVPVKINWYLYMLTGSGWLQRLGSFLKPQYIETDAAGTGVSHLSPLVLLEHTVMKCHCELADRLRQR